MRQRSLPLRDLRPCPDERPMKHELSSEALTINSLAALRPRMRRAADSARRGGPEGATLLRRSMAVYAESARDSQVPEDRFLATIQGELVDVLGSRMSMRRLALLMDAAAQGALDGYERHERLIGNAAHPETPGGIPIALEPRLKARQLE